ncbi:MAG: putative ABC transporter permease [Candidatus Gastranaerophilales bacterium]|nr:putative ABC transporter permease [Candidatus Gastranaerophilales bacterium]
MITHAQTSVKTWENCIFIFFLGSFAGYLWEVLLFFFLEGHFYNRGFFYGPWLPVYGSGALLIFLSLYSQRKRLLFCFVCSALIGGVVELFTGRLLHTVFCSRYWDYTGQFMHIGGYVCLYSVLGFALAGSLFTCYAAPFFLSCFSRIPRRIRRAILWTAVLFFLADACISLIAPNQGPGVTDQAWRSAPNISHALF